MSKNQSVGIKLVETFENIMPSFNIEKIKTYEQAENFAKFISKNNAKFKSFYDIIAFIKPIQKSLGIVVIGFFENDGVIAYDNEKFTFTILLLKLKNNKSIFFRVFDADDKDPSLIEEYVDFSNEQKTREEFYKHKPEHLIYFI